MEISFIKILIYLLIHLAKINIRNTIKKAIVKNPKIIINNKIYPPFSLFVPFPPKGVVTRGAQIREYSRLMYGRPKADVDAEIYSRLRETR